MNKQPTDWVARYVNPDLPEVVIRPDGATFGLLDSGRVIGVTDDPASRDGVREWSELVASGGMDAVVGGYLVVRDRFTGRVLVWGAPLGSIAVAPSRSERTVLDGGLLPLNDDPSGELAERVAARALADARHGRSEPVRFVFDLDDGQHWQVGPSGVTNEGLLDGFTTVERPRLTSSWDEVVDRAVAGDDQSWLHGLVPLLRRNDSDGSWLGGAGVVAVTAVAGGGE